MPDEAPGVADKDHTPPAGPSPLATPSLVQPPGGLRVLQRKHSLGKGFGEGVEPEGGPRSQRPGFSFSASMLRCTHWPDDAVVHATARRQHRRQPTSGEEAVAGWDMGGQDQSHGLCTRTVRHLTRVGWTIAGWVWVWCSSSLEHSVVGITVTRMLIGGNSDTRKPF